MGRFTVVLAMVASMLVAVMGGAAASHDFDDVPDDHDFHDEISWLVERGVTEGWPDNTFRPTNPVSRQAAAAFLFRMAGEPEGDWQSDFDDVPPTHDFYEEISWAAESGITEGWPDNTFRPTIPVSRQAGAAFIFRAVGEPTGVWVSSFDDVPPTHDFYEEISWAATEEITEGWPDNTFRPTVNVSRQAMAAFLFRTDAAGYEFGEPDEEPEFGAVTGTVTDAETDQGIEGATVTVGDESATTAADGTYTIDEVEAGEYTASASADGYQTATAAVEVEADETVTADFFLEPVGDEPDLPFEPGEFTMYVESGSVIIGTDEDEPYVIDFTECPDGEPAEEDAECITFSGTIDEDGDFEIAPEDVFFPDLEDDSGFPALTARTGVSEPITGSIDPETGEATFEVPMRVDIDLFQNGEDDCRIEIGMSATTGQSAELTGSPFADDRLTIVDGLFAVPETTQMGGSFESFCEAVDDEVGLPSPSGENEAVFNLLFTQADD